MQLLVVPAKLLVLLTQLLVLAAEPLMVPAELLMVVVQSLVVEAKHLVGQMPLAILPPPRGPLGFERFHPLQQPPDAYISVHVPWCTLTNTIAPDNSETIFIIWPRAI